MAENQTPLDVLCDTFLALSRKMYEAVVEYNKTFPDTTVCLRDVIRDFAAQTPAYAADFHPLVSRWLARDRHPGAPLLLFSVQPSGLNHHGYWVGPLPENVPSALAAVLGFPHVGEGESVEVTIRATPVSAS